MAEVPAPLTELSTALAKADLATAAAILAQTPWTNLANVLRALPQTQRVSAYQLLDPASAKDVLAELTAPEQAQLRAGHEPPHPTQPPVS